jgi:hypothetical protein
MNLKDLGINADDIRFCDLKTRYARDYVRLGYDKNAIFSQIGSRPGRFAHATIDGRQLHLQSFNMIHFEFASGSADLAEEDTYEAGRELTEIVYYKFPFDAFRQDPPFSIGFLKAVTIRARLLALTPIQDISERNECELMRLSDGTIIWNTQLIQSSAHADDMDAAHSHYRFVCTFVHPTYGFIDFDGAAAASLSAQWASRLAKLPDLGENAGNL